MNTKHLDVSFSKNLKKDILGFDQNRGWFSIFFTKVSRVHMLTQIHMWCKLGQNKISGLNARVDYNHRDVHTDSF